MMEIKGMEMDAVQSASKKKIGCVVEVLISAPMSAAITSSTVEQKNVIMLEELLMMDARVTARSIVAGLVMFSLIYLRNVFRSVVMGSFRVENNVT